MIPKIVHYCWLSGDPFPEIINKCINSWKSLDDYEFILWDYSRFPRGKSKWVDQAFDSKKYAFAADYIRLYALYNYGGIYLDTDVEVVKSFGSLHKLQSMICWQNGIPGLEVAAFGVEKGAQWIKHCLDYYENRDFITSKGSYKTQVLPVVIEELLKNHGYKLIDISSEEEALKNCKDKNIPVFPYDYFSPKSYLTGEIDITSNTYTIHHFSGSWKKIALHEKIEASFWKFFGCRNYGLLSRLFAIINLLRNN